jgi:ATP-binding cassette subfamily B protein
MQPPPTIKQKIKNALRIDRAFLLVWKASRGWTILSMSLSIIQGVFPLLTLYIMKLIIDAITLAVKTGDASASYKQVIFLIIAATLVTIFQSALGLLNGYVAEAQSAVVTDYVAGTLHQKSIAIDLAYYENPDYYDTLHRAQREGPYRPNKIVNGLTQTLQNAVSLIAMVGLLFLFHWGVGILLIVSTIPGLFVQVIHSRKRFEWQKKRTEEERRSGYFSSILSYNAFAKEIRLFDLGDFFSNSFNSLRTLLRGERLSLSRKRSVAQFFVQLFSAVILMGCLMLITIRAIKGLITVGDMVMFYQAFQRGIGALKGLLANIAALYEDNMFVAYFFEFLDIKNEIKDPETPVSVPAQFEKGIAFDNVSFQYPGEREAVIKDISFTIGAGEVVALVGANGAGKSTLVKLLCRLYEPQQGAITMEGFDLSRFTIKELRKQISVVFQDYAQYFLTVRENIWLGDVSLPQDSTKIQKAAEKANADAFIQKLPHGYDTILGRWFHSGEELSLGEWQKIVLARAFLRDSQLIILDEPTSSLDVNTEYHLYMKFRELIAGHSALLISHRFSTVRMADRILVLEGGRIAEQGTHQELLARNGIYADMYTKQAAWLDAVN